MLDFQIEYIATGGNRHPSTADWEPKTGVLAFGADRNVALWSPLVEPEIRILRDIWAKDADSWPKNKGSAFCCAVMMT